MVWHVWGGDGPPVVLLHGGSGSWTHWVRNITALVDAGRRVWIPDLPGFGDSARPPAGGDADALPPWVAQGLDELLGDTPCDLVGFSFGAMVGTFVAEQRPERVRRLVLVGAPALSTQRTRPPGLRSWGGLPPGPELDAIHRHNLRVLMLHDEASLDRLALDVHASNLARDRMKRRRLSQTDVLLRTLPHVRCPVAGIWGAHDVLYRGRMEILEPALARAPRFESLTLIAGAGHWVQFEAAEAFDAALAEVLARPLDAAPAPATGSGA
ncbi:alpha/beta fold hydrolase [Schlegelella sp. ID0723]|uniref:Alpha/beta fold hydrolase n=2 Tax=Piscinibacter koreensis TaxID=2742824 RepID=A0A7Y6NL22_9BURK|nr:alpha/beta fold hydrolase [Schlegelella koreensis]